MKAYEKILSLAESEVGYFGKKSNSDLYFKDKNKSGLFNKYAFELDKIQLWYNGKKNGFDYCAIFYDWLFVHTFGVDLAREALYRPKSSLSAGVKYAAQYYKQNKSFHSIPEIGDQIIFGTSTVYKHTGIVTEIKGNIITTIEGNAGSPSAVRKCHYSVNYNKILGYGRPNWEVLKMDENIPSVWAKEAWEWGIAKGITDGSFPQDYATREQIVTMLYRTFKEVTKNEYK